MKILTLIFALILYGCGDSVSAKPGGVLVNPEYVSRLKTDFAKVEECTKLKGETFESLHVEIFPYDFPCRWKKGNFCSGEFAEPNIIMLSQAAVFRHELIHYLLYLNLGDSDPNHESPLFKSCQFIF